MNHEMPALPDSAQIQQYRDWYNLQLIPAARKMQADLIAANQRIAVLEQQLSEK